MRTEVCVRWYSDGFLFVVPFWEKANTIHFEVLLHTWPLSLTRDNWLGSLSNASAIADSPKIGFQTENIFKCFLLYPGGLPSLQTRCHSWWSRSWGPCSRRTLSSSPGSRGALGIGSACKTTWKHSWWQTNCWRNILNYMTRDAFMVQMSSFSLTMKLHIFKFHATAAYMVQIS